MLYYVCRVNAFKFVIKTYYCIYENVNTNNFAKKLDLMFVKK